MGDLGAAEEAIMIESIISDVTLTEEQITAKLRTSIKSHRINKHSSLLTIFNISNALMGSALLVMPINFYNSGLISSMITGGLIAVISFLTANLMIIHSRDDEIDYPEAIVRVLGYGWKLAFNIVSMLLLLLVGIIHFILMAQIFYSILQNSFPDDNHNWGSTKEITFEKFSFQYVGIILFGFIMILFSLGDLKHILKVNDKGIYMILVFCLFLIYTGIDVFINCDVKFVQGGEPGQMNKGLEMVLFTGDVGTLIGIFALAYFSHNIVVGIMKYNKDSSKNTRDLGLSYVVVFILYSILGIAGMIAVAGLFNAVYFQSDGKLPSTIAELLVNNPFLGKVQKIFASISLGLVFIQLSTVLPILCFFTRRQFFDLVLGSRKKIPTFQFHLFNILFAFCCLVVEILVLDINVVVGFTGAVGGFLLVYIIPITLHLKCSYSTKGRKDSEEKSEVFLSKEEDENKVPTDTEKNENPNQNTQSTFLYKHCRDHEDIWIKNKLIAYTFWGGIVVFGVFVLVALFYDLFK